MRRVSFRHVDLTTSKSSVIRDPGRYASLAVSHNLHCALNNIANVTHGGISPFSVLFSVQDYIMSYAPMAGSRAAY